MYISGTENILNVLQFKLNVISHFKYHYAFLGPESIEVTLVNGQSKSILRSKRRCSKLIQNRRNTSESLEQTQPLNPEGGNGNGPAQIYNGGPRDSNPGPNTGNNSIDSSNAMMRKQENRLTRISLGIVSLYILCHMWRILPTAYEALYSEDGTLLSKWPHWLIHVYHLSHTLIVTNSAINFLIYVVL